MPRLILPRSGSSLMLKSHVKGYDRKDGTHVAEHDDKRQKKAGDAYSHPHVVGKATITDEHSTGAHDASTMQFAGTNYSTTGKQGKSFHDETPVREFESEGDGHRVWMDHSARVHADSKTEVDSLRKKHEAHVAGQQGEDAPIDDKDRFNAGAGDPVHGSEGGSGVNKPEKVEKAAVLEAALGPHNATGYVAIPSGTNGKVKTKMMELADKVKPLGFNPPDKDLALDANGNGSLELTNEAGQRVVITAQDAGDRTKVSVSLLDAAPGADKAAGGGGAASGSKDPASGGAGAPGGDKPAAKAEPKPKAKEEGGDKAPAALKQHAMWSQSDFDYFKAKGYSPDEIKEIWDRDAAAGHKPVEHKDAPDVVGYFKKGGGKDFGKAIADGVRLLLGRKT
jgi:hypothetical protein